MGLPTPPVVILTAALTQLGRLHQRKVALKTWTVVNLAGCYNRKGNELANIV